MQAAWKTMFQSLLIWGTYIWGVLLFEWVLIFEKSVASVHSKQHSYLAMDLSGKKDPVLTKSDSYNTWMAFCVGVACTFTF